MIIRILTNPIVTVIFLIAFYNVMSRFRARNKEDAKLIIRAFGFGLILIILACTNLPKDMKWLSINVAIMIFTFVIWFLSRKV